MAGPFPGMDPYIECQGGWPDFHNRLIAEACNALGAQLPDKYVPRVDERIELVVAVSRHDHDEIRNTWLEVRHLPTMELVTVIEVLSPTNKTGMGRDDYLEKREKCRARNINFVEIDLLLGGHRVPMKQPVRQKGHYFAIVARSDKLHMDEVYSWSLRDSLPAIPIPLRTPDEDVAIDLQELVNRVYDVGRYRRTLCRDRPLPRSLPLDLPDRSWAEAISRAL